MEDHLQPDLGRLLPSAAEKDLLEVLRASSPITVSGARDDPEEALVSLLDALDDLGLIKDSTTET